MHFVRAMAKQTRKLLARSRKVGGYHRVQLVSWFCQGSRQRRRNEQFSRYIRTMAQSDSAMLSATYARKF